MDGTQTNINVNGTIEDRSAFGFPLNHDCPRDAAISRCKSVRPRSSEQIESCVDQVSELVAIEIGNEPQSFAKSKCAGHNVNNDSPYSADPYVADPNHPAAYRSVEEILESIQGYANVYDLVDEQSENEGSPAETELPVGSDCEFNSNANPADGTNTDSIEWELDVINFVDACSDSSPGVGDHPIPIRGGFELEAEDDQRDGFCDLDADQAFFAQSSESVSGKSDFNETGNQTGNETVSRPQGSSKRFVASDGEVIQIDGNDGFDYIDLECFSVSDVSFQSNRIEIHCDAGTHFQVEYRNISHAVFADGVEIEL